MKLVVLFSLLFPYLLFAQQPEEFVVEIEPLTINNAPGVHSYGAGITSDGKWVIVGGRIDGLHRRQPFAAFLEQDNNKSVFVIDPVAEQVWSASLDVLPASIFEQLQSTNQQSHQRENTLYVTGGYGFSTTTGGHITYPNLTAIALDELADAVINGTSIVPFFRQITDTNLKVTGGQLGYKDSTFYLVGGHLFDGAYNPMGPTHGPGFTQVYTEEIRTFKIEDDGTNLAITDYQATNDPQNLHRRDYNMVPQIYPNGEVGYTVFSGVFDVNDLPFLNPVDITGPADYTPSTTFNQYLSHYHSATLPIYDTAANVMHTLFFGGMSQFTLDNTGTLVEDTDVPFVKTISRITRDANGIMQEVDLGYIEMPSLVGSGAEFIPTHQYYYGNEILDLNAVPNTRTLVGYIYGGIESSGENIFFINDGTQSSASNTIFKVFINKSTAGIEEEIPLQSSNILNLNVSPNPVSNALTAQFFGANMEDMHIRIYNQKGQLVLEETHAVTSIGKQSFKLNTSALKKGNYILKVDNGVVSDQKNFVKL